MNTHNIIPPTEPVPNVPTLYLPMDNETGGLDDKVSLLSTYLEVCDDKLNVIDSLELYVKPNDGLYIVEAEGLEVNGIDLVEHDLIAKSYSEAGQILFKFLQKNSANGNNRLIPVGKNVNGDILSINRSLLNKNTWNRFVSYRTLDITSLALGMQLAKKLPSGMSLSLTSLIKYFNVTVPGKQHEAKYDVKAQMIVLQKLMELM